MDNLSHSCDYRESDLCKNYCEAPNFLCNEVTDKDKLFAGYSEIVNQRNTLNNRLLYDELTGLHNKPTFMDMAQSYLEDAKTNNKSVGLIVLDINNFKKFNEVEGHIEGDALLGELGMVLRDQLRFEDLLIARFGGDEFLFLCDLDPRNSDTLMTAEERLFAARDRVAQSVNNRLKQFARYLSGAFGVSVWDGKQTLKELISSADKRMYADKKHKKHPHND